ncbi:Hypothetical protein LEPBI_I2235 [Leptospira biflexa serovar Patoc strain 'Patoc 1 (Paris)']|uniref:Uncharacterized protein n=1 Tax=Leptospira biflexa serovar Patoc (strain Patoc 1 / ATCC 23582 / Paris) TaxID=456481 RepID=B0ST92_LEPBP|nr:Hypothetical protein LEPBI_I2235 [Leptospira biflexa serovar Patoc strain 'Patoc 1 (Paris)']
MNLSKDKTLKIILAIEYIFKDRAGDELPLWDLIELIKKIPVCSDLSSLEIEEVIQNYLISGFLQSEPRLPLNEDTLLSKTNTHPSLSISNDHDKVIYLP